MNSIPPLLFIHILTISRITARLLANSHTQPQYHALARPQIAETEATYRAISLSTLTSTPILIVHMSSPVAISHARKAQSKLLLPVHAETCPHYLYLLSERLAATSVTVTDDNLEDHESHEHVHGERHTQTLSDSWSGASHVCAPPLRHSDADLQAVWDGVHNGTITVISSDHAPSRYNNPRGKRKPVVEAEQANNSSRDEGNDAAPTITTVVPSFAQIPNGLPGIETRLPVLFSAATASRSSSSMPASSGNGSSRTLSLPKFVELTSTNPARLYGLSGRKGSIAPGYDADLVIWYPASHPDAACTITNSALHHAIDYTPFEGIKVNNWPRYVLLRGEVKWDRGVELREGYGRGLLGQPVDGKYLKRGSGEVLVGRGGQNPQGMTEGERSAWL